MDVNKQYYYRKKIGVYLVFFSLLVAISCTKPSKIKDLSVVYSQGEANYVTFESTGDTDAYKVFLKGNTATPVLGSFTLEGKKAIFKPVIPFSRGMSYELKRDDKTLVEFTVSDSLENTKKPRVLNIYPSRDTVPENLLKIYLVFSKPMQEVHAALDYIKVYNITKDAPTNIFLPLQNELWNQEHTELTLWLDPGRIKRDLIPNREKGQPLEQGNSYRIRIDQQWQDAQGTNLEKAVVKTFFVGERDSKKPNVKTWKLHIPKKETLGALTITFTEAMDAMLLKETLRIRSADTKKVAGKFKISRMEQELIFQPNTSWKTGDYQLVIDSKLEDLAGNNLNHLFDKDLLSKDTDPDTQFKSLFFTIK
jgi:hypothetical protein